MLPWLSAAVVLCITASSYTRKRGSLLMASSICSPHLGQTKPLALPKYGAKIEEEAETLLGERLRAGLVWQVSSYSVAVQDSSLENPCPSLASCHETCLPLDPAIRTALTCIRQWQPDSWTGTKEEVAVRCSSESAAVQPYDRASHRPRSA